MLAHMLVHVLQAAIQQDVEPQLGVEDQHSVLEELKQAGSFSSSAYLQEAEAAGTTLRDWLHPQTLVPEQAFVW